MNDDSTLSVCVIKGGNNYGWEPYRDGIALKVKHYAPIYMAEESAMAAGCKRVPFTWLDWHAADGGRDAPAVNDNLLSMSRGTSRCFNVVMSVSGNLSC